MAFDASNTFDVTRGLYEFPLTSTTPFSTRLAHGRACADFSPVSRCDADRAPKRDTWRPARTFGAARHRNAFTRRRRGRDADVPWRLAPMPRLRMLRGDERRRRGRDADISRGNERAATPRPRRGCSVEIRTDAAAATRIFPAETSARRRRGGDVDVETPAPQVVALAEDRLRVRLHATSATRPLRDARRGASPNLELDLGLRRAVVFGARGQELVAVPRRR